MKSATTRATLALLLSIFCVLAFGEAAIAAAAAAGAGATGRLELTVLSGAEDACAQCTAMATNMSTGYTATLTMSPSGKLAAELPVGTYMVVIMPSGGMGSPSMTPATPTIPAVATSPAIPAIPAGITPPSMLNVTIVAGQTLSKTVVFGDPVMPDEFDEDYLDSLFDVAPGGGRRQATDVDLGAVPTEDELISLARRYHDLYWDALTFDERSLVEPLTWQLDLHSDGPFMASNVEEITTTAAALAAPGASRSASVVLAARAVMEMPGFGLALNNFGAILRMLGEIPDSIAVLSAGREIDPESPMILTNLANSVRELGNLRLAESLYLEALRADDDFGPALSALGEIYMERGDCEKALDILVRGSMMGFCARVSDSLADALDEAYGDSDQPPPRPPAWSSVPLVPLVAQHSHAMLVLPRFGDWGTIASLAGSLEPLREVAVKTHAQYGSAAQQDVELKRKIAAMADSGKYDVSGRFPIVYDKQVLHLRLIQEHFWKTAAQAMDRASEQANVDASRARYASMVTRYMQRMARAGTQAEQDQIAAEFCAEAAAFARAEFAKNKPIWSAMNAVVTPAIEDYWAFCQPILDSIHDPLVYELEELHRRITVYKMINGAYDMTEVLAAMPTSHSDCARCGGTGKAPVSAGDSEVPPDPDDKCPFKGGMKFSISLGPMDYSVTCTTVEIGFAAGAAGSVTWDFKQKRVTQIFVGAGVQSGVGPAKLAQKAGLQVTFDSDGSVSDVGGYASASISLGPISPGFSSAGGLVVGLPGISVPIGR